LLAPAVVCGLGLADDIRPIAPAVRLGGEAAAGALCGLVVGGGSVGEVVVGAILMVALTNTVNLLDGLDAVAAATTAVCALGLAALGADRIRTVGLALVGALLGFVVYNRPPARVYLGDAGSYLIGGFLTTLILALWADPTLSTGALVVVPMVVAIPVADTSIAIIRRRRSGQPIWTGDRSHIYDQLAARGLSLPATAAVCAGAQGVYVLIAYAVSDASTAVALGVEVLGLAALAAVLVVYGFTSPGREMAA
jgi:UDP-GlcNAc:undecaprenyl-phosphate GlcNAc-1-phosphate transferase